MEKRGGGPGEDALHFGAFTLSRLRRTLTEAGRPIRLGGRAIEILIALVERSGEVVSKRELLNIAWPHAFVDEANLRVHIAAIRKALGDGSDGVRYIVNVSGQGYLFSLPVSPVAPATDPEVVTSAPRALFADTPAAPRRHRLIGREDVVESLTAMLAHRRLVTIVGPAGVGKSAVAQATCEESAALGPDGVFFVELSALRGDAPVTDALASALGVSVNPGDPIGSLVARLGARQIVIGLDNCEHMIEAAADVVEQLLERATGVRFLATSREPLLVADESVFRLAPLAAPPAGEVLSAEAALAYPAVQLFIERALNSSETFKFGDAEAVHVAEICRRLDGLPLAIELVAARVDLFGVGGLETALNDRLMLAARRNRTGQPRQQSIRGALDWSYDLLSDVEKLVLQRFSMFRGPFTLSSASRLAAGDDLSISQVVDALEALTTKSLVAVDAGGASIFYRLLHVTRAYASEKLADSGQAPLIARLHAEHIRDLMAYAETRWDTLGRADWLAEFGYTIDDVRAALDWAFSSEGDIAVAAALTASTLPFGVQLSLVEEFVRRAELALREIASSHVASARSEFQLTCQLTNLYLVASPDRLKLEELSERTWALAEKLGPRYKIEPLLIRSIYALELGDNVGAMGNMEVLLQTARDADDPLAVLLANRVAAQVLQFAGEQQRAIALAEEVIRHPAKSIPLAYSHTGLDRQISMRLLQARSLWQLGKADQARDRMADCMERAYRDGTVTVTFALAMGACPLAAWTGDIEQTRTYAQELCDFATRYSTGRWLRIGNAFQAVLDRPENGGGGVTWDIDATIRQLASQMQLEMLVTVDERLMTPALAARATSNLCGWCNPEMLRAAGEMYRRAGSDPLAPSPLSLFQASLEEARATDSLAWELRTAISLARLWREDGEGAKARDLLEATLGKFSEGAWTGDYKAAVALLADL